MQYDHDVQESTSGTVIVLCFSAYCSMTRHTPDLISMYFNMDVCHKYIPVFFGFSGAASIGFITYMHCLLKDLAKAELWICLAPETFSPVTFIVTEVTYDINR